MEDGSVSITNVFKQLKENAEHYGAAKVDFKFEDNDWEYIVSVKRKGTKQKEKKNDRSTKS